MNKKIEWKSLFRGWVEITEKQAIDIINNYIYDYTCVYNIEATKKINEKFKGITIEDVFDKLTFENQGVIKRLDGIYIEFNEYDIKYNNKKVDEPLIRHLQRLNDKLHKIQLTEKDGYYKFYFHIYKNGKLLEKRRIDLADGETVNIQLGALNQFM